MKNIFIQIGSVIILMMAIIAVEAQTPKTFRANIPFEFSVGNKTFEAGKYIIEQANPGISNSGLIIRNAENYESKIFMVIKLPNNELSSISKLIFNRYENQYFLSEMITPTTSAKFYQLKKEKLLAKKNKMSRETVGLN